MKTRREAPSASVSLLKGKVTKDTNNTNTNLNQSQAVESYLNPSERQASSMRRQSGGKSSNINGSKESSSLFN